MDPLSLAAPGLFITATDTEVGKTLVTCALLHAMRQQAPQRRVGAIKPIATGCDRIGGDLQSTDAAALARAMHQSPEVDAATVAAVNPVRYRPGVAPAVAAELEGRPIDFAALSATLTATAKRHDFLLVEGIGGLMVPLDRRRTLRDMIVAVGYPVLVVARATLGTINHTAMTIALLEQAGCAVRGIILNDANCDPMILGGDASRATNREWVEHMTGRPVLATLPYCPDVGALLAEGRLPSALVDPLLAVDWFAAEPAAAAIARGRSAGREN